MCSTDFFGVHDSGSRAKARNEAESSRSKRQLLIAQLAMYLRTRQRKTKLGPQTLVARSP